MNFEAPIDLSVETHLENLEIKQDQIIKMLQQFVCYKPARFAGYLSIEEASQKYGMDHKLIHQKMNLFRRVKNRPLDMRSLNDGKFYSEWDMTEVVLLDQKIEIQKLLNLLE